MSHQARIADMNHVLYPTDPDEYLRTDHIEDILNEECRNMTEDLITETIQTGELKKARGNADAQFVKNYHGVEVYVLVGYDDTAEKPVIITGWPQVFDGEQAAESDRWNKKQIDQITEFNNK
jgi:hypothetical protein